MNFVLCTNDSYRFSSKIIHDCRQASDLLFHHFDIHLVNVYDTQVDSVVFYDS